MKNIGLMLTTKTNKTELYWKNQQPQTALARPGSVLAPQGPAEHPVLVPAGARRRGPALGTRGAPRGFCAGPVCAVGTAGPVLQTAGDSVRPRPQTRGVQGHSGRRGLFDSVQNLGGLNRVLLPAR